jgi:peptidoglycan/xylan/chitin deacetylase (PgdA/CDA1 family)
VRQAAKGIITISAFALPVKFLIKLTDKQHIFPFYHTVSDEEPLHIKHLYPVKTVQQFERDLDFFLKHFKAADFPKILREEKPAFHLSFDDGLRECAEIIAPILLKKGIPATFFLNTDFIDNKGLFYKYKISLLIEKIKHKASHTQIQSVKELLSTRNPIKKLLQLSHKNNELIEKTAEITDTDFSDYLKTNKPYMDAEQIKTLVRQGFKIGSHGRSHPLFSHISLDEQKQQIGESMNFIKNNFDIHEKLFAFPFTDSGVSQALFDFLRENHITDYTFGTAGIKNDTERTHIQRIATERNRKAATCIKAEMLGYFIKKILRKETVCHEN